MAVKVTVEEEVELQKVRELLQESVDTVKDVLFTSDGVCNAKFSFLSSQFRYKVTIEVEKLPDES